MISASAVGVVVSAYAFEHELPIDHEHQLAALEGDVKSSDLFLPGFEHFGVILAE